MWYYGFASPFMELLSSPRQVSVSDLCSIHGGRGWSGHDCVRLFVLDGVTYRCDRRKSTSSGEHSVETQALTEICVSYHIVLSKIVTNRAEGLVFVIGTIQENILKQWGW